MRFPSASSDKSGFSLIEIILAIGIISFALVGILGLFPVAVNAATNSQRETQAALIARTIFDQLEARSESAIRKISVTDDFDDESPSPVTVNLNKGGVGEPIEFDADGIPMASSTSPQPAYRVEVAVTPLMSPDLGLSQVTVTVSPVAARDVHYPFASVLLRQ